MLKDQIARNKAAEALGLPNDRRHWLSDDWPETIDISWLVELQFPGDTSTQAAIQKDIKNKIANDEIPKRYDDHYMVAENPPLTANDFYRYVLANGFVVSEHIKAWHSATYQPAELKENVNPLTKLAEQQNAIGNGDVVQNSTELKPWLEKNPNDPEPKYDWYTPARYFARELVKDDPTLLTKLDLLANKVVKSLDKVEIKKRGGKKSFESGTIKKALSNVILG